LTDKKLEQLSENLELDSMFDLLCDNVDKVEQSINYAFDQKMPWSGVSVSSYGDWSLWVVRSNPAGV
jgi:hypothetical protein